MAEKHFTMSDEQYARLLEACRPVPYLIIGGVPPRSQQDNVNEAWQQLGNSMGFDWTTVRPGNTEKSFYAEMKDTPALAALEGQ
jgi:hypothetical protein